MSKYSASLHKSLSLSQLFKKYAEKQIFLIAEIGTVHGTWAEGMRQAKKLIDAAAAGGAAAVKFQHVIADEILHPLSGKLRLLGKDINLYQRFKKLEQPPQFFRELRDYTQKQGLLFFSSFFGEQSFRDLQKLELEAFKIASAESGYLKLWNLALSSKAPSLAHTPIIASIGMSDEATLRLLLAFLASSKHAVKENIALLQCVVAYPAAAHEYNLLAMLALAQRSGYSSGLSDHSQDPFFLPSLAAFLKGMLGHTLLLEKHIKLEGSSLGLDDPFAISPLELALLSKMMKRCYSLGSDFSNGSALVKTLQETLRQCIKLENTLSLEKQENFIVFKKKLSKEMAIALLLAYKENVKEHVNSKNLTYEGFLNQASSQHARLESSIFNTLGSLQFHITKSEQAYYKSTKRSLIALKDMAANTFVAAESAAFLRSEQNTSPGFHSLENNFEQQWQSQKIRLKTIKAVKNGQGLNKSNCLVL